MDYIKVKVKHALSSGYLKSSLPGRRTAMSFTLALTTSFAADPSAVTQERRAANDPRGTHDRGSRVGPQGSALGRVLGNVEPAEPGS